MMQRHRCLNQALQELLLYPRRLPPNILPNLMRVIKLPRIKQPNSALIALRSSKSHKPSILLSEQASVRTGLCGDGRPARPSSANAETESVLRGTLCKTSKNERHKQ